MKYYCYHRAISHPLERCITLKKHIMQLAKDGRVILDMDNTAEANSICAQLELLPSRWESHVHLYLEERHYLTLSLRMELFTIQFISLEQIAVPLMVQASPLETNLTIVISEDNEGGGPLSVGEVPRRKRRTNNHLCVKERDKGRRRRNVGV